MRRACLLPLLLLALAGCAGLPAVDRPAIASEAHPACRTQTNLGRIASAYRPDPLHSGFRLMPLGSFSLDTRVRAGTPRRRCRWTCSTTTSRTDETGRWLLRALRDAAARGVRVRLLIDDFYTSGARRVLPRLCRASRTSRCGCSTPSSMRRDGGQATRFVSAVGDWKRVNHRMHNKLFIADGAMAVIGGRNVANEYFLRSASRQLHRRRRLRRRLRGRRRCRALFDRYWNSDAGVPAASRRARQPLDAAELRATLRRSGPARQLTPPPAAAAAERHARLRPDQATTSTTAGSA